MGKKGGGLGGVGSQQRQRSHTAFLWHVVISVRMYSRNL